MSWIGVKTLKGMSFSTLSLLITTCIHRKWLWFKLYMYTQETHTDITRYDSMCFNAAPTLYMNDNFIIELKNRFVSWFPTFVHFSIKNIHMYWQFTALCVSTYKMRRWNCSALIRVHLMKIFNFKIVIKTGNLIN